FVAVVFSMLFVFFEDIKVVADTTNFAVFLTFISVNLSVVILRKKMPEAKRSFKVPLNLGNTPILPILGSIFALFMVGNLDQKSLTYGFGFVLMGWFIYDFYQREYKGKKSKHNKK
ncbi:MAG TPA: hypothetical protein VI912_05620, partial [Candidatus Bilamarchaeaceae archaeon]|nr:hypothetical protein [Candidatus Bilamarchaeaceae archaeon]